MRSPALLAAVLLLISPMVAADPAAEQLAERMLAALGGRDAWARAKNTVRCSALWCCFGSRLADSP